MSTRDPLLAVLLDVGGATTKSIPTMTLVLFIQRSHRALVDAGPDRVLVLAEPSQPVLRHSFQASH